MPEKHESESKQPSRDLSARLDGVVEYMNNKVGFTAGELKDFKTISAKIKEKLDLQTKEDREAYENVHSKLLNIFNRCHNPPY